jgi:hypothetical protein
MTRKRRYEIAFSLFIVLVVGWFVLQAAGAGPFSPPLPRGWGQKSSLFPLVIGIPTLALALLQLGLEVRGARAAKVSTVSAAHTAADAEPEVPPELVRRRTAIILATTVGFVLATWLFGFTLSVPLVTLLYLKFGAGEQWPISLILTAVAGISFYFIFVEGLGVPMPEGVVISLLYTE